MRLQKFLSRSGVASRRKCDAEIIPSGRVSVNGVPVTELGTTVDPESDVVALDGKPLSLPSENTTLMLNKPAGFETTMSNKHGGRIVSSLVPVSDYRGLVPVGRLDKDTTGLLLFTTDGEMCNGLMHPGRNVEKVYLARIEGRLSEKERMELECGVDIDGRLTAPAKVEVLRFDGRRHESDVRIGIHEGRNRQVRKMFSAVGHEVLRLHREKFGPLELGSLAEGEWRLLDDGEVALLLSACART